MSMKTPNLNGIDAGVNDVELEAILHADAEILSGDEDARLLLEAQEQMRIYHAEVERLKREKEINARAIPCQKNVELFSSPYLESFDSEEFKEEHSELRDDDLTIALNVAETQHDLMKTQTVSHAKSLCRTCPILDICRERILSTETRLEKVYGVVAEMEYSERKSMRSKRKRDAKISLNETSN